MPALPPFDLPPDLLDAAAALCELPQGDRGPALAALQAAHPGHAEALAEFMRWLASSGRLLATVQHAPCPAELPQFDGYRVVRALGEGAFGIVWLGEQPAPIQRQVAIKLLRPGAGDRGTLARFDAERGFLARLHHPAIAQIFDTGLLADGRPWFAMEYVPGVPLGEYCDRGRLPVDARLRLFVRLCQGVQHAHDHGVVHRDLKPANVLVVDVDGEAQPKIIDFGVARALERGAADGGTRTETGRIVGTPGYMSPEQMAGDLAAIGARSDVFSLGVVLYELLTGDLPWGKRPTSTDSEPPRPSARVTTNDRRGAAVAQQRGSQPKKLAARLRGDLDWIVLKALAREPERRYATVSGLAADVQRHLRSETVSAGPPALGHRLRKFVRRHRAAVVTSVGVTVLVAVGLVVLGSYRSIAKNRTSDAEAAVASLLARANDPSLRNNTNYVALRQQMSAEAIALYERFLGSRPDDAAARLGRVRALTTLTTLHFMLAEYAAAERVAREAVADGERLVAAVPDDPDTTRCLAMAARHLARALVFQSRTAEARAPYQRAADLCERLGTDEPSDVDALVIALQGVAVTFDLDREGEQRAATLARAAALQAANLNAHPERRELREEVVNIAILRANDAAYRGDFTTARDLLAPTAGWLEDGQGLSRGVILKVHDLGAKVAVACGDVAGAIGRAERGLAGCRAWLQNEPAAQQPFGLADGFLSTLADLHAGDAAFAERVRPLREWVALSADRMQHFPEDTIAALHPLVYSTWRLSEESLTTGCREDLAGIEVPLRLASRLVHELPPYVDAATRRVLALYSRGSLGLVADALGLADADGIWEEAARELAAFDAGPEADTEVTGRRVMYAVHIIARRLAAGRFDEARALLEHTQTLHAGSIADQRRKNGPTLARLRVRLALQHGDLIAAREAVDEMLEGGATWRDLTFAAEAAYSGWRAASRGNAKDAIAWRDQCLELCRRAVDACRDVPHQDVWVVLPSLQCRLRIALVGCERGDAAAPAAVADVLPSLATWRERAHADQWDESLYRDGQTSVAR